MPPYTSRASGPGWIRTVATPKAGLVVTGITLVDAFGIPVNTQCTPFNWHADGSIRHAVLIARVTKAGPYTLAYDPPPLALPVMPTPVWPNAAVTFTDGGVSYSAFLPNFTDVNPWVTGPLAIERSLVLVPTAGSNAHPLVQVVCDVCSYVDGSTRVVFGLTNSRDTVTAARVNMGALTFTIGASTIYGPETHTLYEGQYGIQVGFAGGHLAARLHPDPRMLVDAGVVPDVMPIVESPAYAPHYVMGGFMDMAQSVPMQVGGGRPELGPVLTKAQAEYVAHPTDSIYDQIIAQANCAGSWSGYLCGADGTTLSVTPDFGNKSTAGYGQYYMLEGAHLLHLTTFAFLLTADPCYWRQTVAWGEEIMEGVWGLAANPTSYSGGAAAAGTFLDYDYSKHVDGNLCFLGASGFAEPRFIGRTLTTLIEGALFTPKSQAKLKTDLTLVVNQNIARLDVSYARRPPFGPWNVPGIEFDPGKGLGNSYGAVHLLYASISFWQWYEVAMALYHAYRNGFTTDLSMLKRICGSFLKLWEDMPREKWGNLAVVYYARYGHKVPDGPLTPITSIDEFIAANWGASPPAGMPAWDGDDNNGNPGPDYYALEYYTLLSLAKWLGLKSPVLEDALAFMRARAVPQAPSRAHYAFLIGDDVIAIANPPVDPPIVIVPPVVTEVASNWALSSFGSTVTASTSAAANPNIIIDGNRKGSGNTGTVWISSPGAPFPQWVVIDFGQSRYLNTINVFSAQNSTPVEPTPTLTFATEGNTAYVVQSWDGLAWQPIPGAAVTGNHLVMNSFSFPEFATTKIRVLITEGGDRIYARLAEVEAWGYEEGVPLPVPPVVPPSPVLGAVEWRAEIWTADQLDDDHADNVAVGTMTPVNPPPVAPPVVVVEKAALALGKPVFSDTAPVRGSSITVTWPLTNRGPAGSTNDSVMARIPKGCTFVSAAASQGTYNAATGLWTVGTVANGVTATLAITARVT